jgi:hypothetical protein
VKAVIERSIEPVGRRTGPSMRSASWVGVEPGVNATGSFQRDARGASTSRHDV